jgi:hypothetical protein
VEERSMDLHLERLMAAGRVTRSSDHRYLAR